MAYKVTYNPEEDCVYASIEGHVVWGQSLISD